MKKFVLFDDFPSIISPILDRIIVIVLNRVLLKNFSYYIRELQGKKWFLCTDYKPDICSEP